MKISVRGTRMRLVIFMVVFSTISISLSGIYGNGGYIRYRNLCNLRNDLNSEVSKLEDEIEYISHQLDNLKESSFKVEKIAREDFGLAKPGEIIIIFDEPGFREIISESSGQLRY